MHSAVIATSECRALVSKTELSEEGANPASLLLLALPTSDFEEHQLDKFILGID